MINSTIQIGLVAIAALGIAGAAAIAGPSSNDFACGISTTTDRGMMAIEGVVQTQEAMSGDYRFALKSSGSGGSSNINQGGQFTATPGSPVSLGRVMINAGSKVDVEFTVRKGGETIDCSAPLTSLT